ncbi:SCO family protein [Methylomonas fluvii]|uniref:SCO family protein n=1 Tax=Methylomonas fluvii TaxID=1854564 RepID=A0ABR9DIP6_9GAMM|nr:SCO family protein [Methylomonas fluvii]MBD9361747.1 SCO family protein [Methylomonas fluvii]
MINKTVLDQGGAETLFYEHLIQDKTVAINFVFTRCTAICPISGAIFRQVQQQLAGRKVQLISISVDPAFDSVEQLQQFSQKFGAAANWRFVTGERAVIVEILKSLGVYTVDKNQHSNMVIVGDDATARWIRLYGLPQARQIVAAIDQVSSAARR